MAPSQKDGASPTPPKWSKIFSDLLCQAGIGIFEIPEMTIPQIEAIRGELGEQISLKIGMPSIFGGSLEYAPSIQAGTSQAVPDKPPKLSQFMAFTDAFNE